MSETMTAGELIKYLSLLPPETSIVMQQEDYPIGDYGVKSATLQVCYKLTECRSPDLWYNFDPTKQIDLLKNSDYMIKDVVMLSAYNRLD